MAALQHQFHEHLRDPGLHATPVQPEAKVAGAGRWLDIQRGEEHGADTQLPQTADGQGAAALLNPKVNQWLKGPWGRNANVVAMDYFSNTNLVDLAIQVNAYKGFSYANKDYVNLEILNLC